MSDNKKYMLEITMESRAGDKHHYIKRSFPVERGVLDISKYGHPYTLFNKVEIGNLIGMDSCYLEIFRGNPFRVHSLQQSYHLAFSLYFAGSWLKLYSRIILKIYFHL